jgi:hypothetical protein
MGVLALDTFTRSDSADLGTNWEPNQSAFKVASFQAKAVAPAGDACERNKDVTWPDNQYSKVTLGTCFVGAIDTGYGPAVRISTVTLIEFYRLIASTGGWALVRFNAGVSATVASSAGTTFTDGDVVELQVSGTGATVSFVMKKNGVEFSAGTTDVSGSRLVTGSAGVSHSSSTLAANGIESWEGGDLQSDPGPDVEDLMGQMAGM